MASSVTGIDRHHPSHTRNSFERSREARLFGREAETRQLREIYQQVKQEHTANIVAVFGGSGCGKTALVETLRVPVNESGGFFCDGKYNKNSGNYSAFMTALGDLCVHVSKSSGFGPEQRAHIIEAMGSDCHLLQASIPNFDMLVNIQTGDHSDFDTKSVSAFAKFKVACKNFLQVIASAEHPVVIFLDDVQWMDEGSNEVFGFLIDQTEIKNLLFVVTSREEDAPCISSLRSHSGINMSTTCISISNLDGSAIFLWVSALLLSCSDRARELSEIVFQRTLGNPFYVNQLLATLQRENLLVRPGDVHATWQFNVDAIRDKAPVPESLVEILTRRIQSLPDDMQDIFKLASLLGYSWEEEVLEEMAVSILTTKRDISSDISVSPAHQSNLYLALKAAKEAGLVEKCRNRYQFSHDKVHDAFRSLLPEARRNELRLAIGKVYRLEDTPEGLYNAAQHLNQVVSLLDSPANKLDLANLNLEASKYCLAKYAFTDALDYLRQGLLLMDKMTMWHQQPTLSLELTESLAKVELICGNYKTCDELCITAIANTNSVEAQLKSLSTRTEVRIATLDYDDALDVARDCFHRLGVEIPNQLSKRHILFKMLRVRRLIGKKSDEELLARPILADDQRYATAIKVCFQFCILSIPSGNDDMFSYFALLAVELAMINGLTAYSAPGFVVYASAYLKLNDRRRAYRFSDFAMKVIETTKCPDTECATVVLAQSLVVHARVPRTESIMVFDKMMHRGYETGDVLFGFHCFLNGTFARLFKGENLKQVESYFREHYRRASETKQQPLLTYIKPIGQYTLNLQATPPNNNWKDLTAFTGELMNEDELIVYLRDNWTVILQFCFSSMKLAILFHLGFPEYVGPVLDDLDLTGETAKLHISAPSSCFMAGSLNYQLYQKSRARKALRTAKKYKKRLVQQAQASSTAASLLEFLKADELCCTSKRSQKAAIVNAYESAMQAMSNEGFLHLEGAANERLAFYLVGIKCVAESSEYFERALYLYGEHWGASAKVQRLKEQRISALESSNVESFT